MKVKSTPKKEKKVRKNHYPIELPNGKRYVFQTRQQRSSFLEYYSKLEESNLLNLILKAEKFIRAMPKYIYTQEYDWNVRG